MKKGKKSDKKIGKKLEKVLFHGLDPKMCDLLRPSVEKLNNTEKGLLTLMVLTQRAHSKFMQEVMNELIPMQSMNTPAANVFYPDIVHRNGSKKKSKK